MLVAGISIAVVLIGLMAFTHHRNRRRLPGNPYADLPVNEWDDMRRPAPSRHAGISQSAGGVMTSAIGDCGGAGGDGGGCA